MTHKQVFPLETFIISCLLGMDKKPRPLSLPNVLGVEALDESGTQAAPHHYYVP